MVDFCPIIQHFYKTFQSDIRNYILGNLDRKYLKQTYDIVLENNLVLEKKSDAELFYLYYIFRRRFPVGAKQVLYSKKISQNALFKQYQKQIHKIVAALETGKSIREYLPYDIGNLRRCSIANKKTDGLLLGWNITHLHLFTRKEREELLKSDKKDDKYIIYVIAASDRIFFIDIQDHNHLADTELLSIVNDEVCGTEVNGFFSNEQLTPTEFDKNTLKKLRNIGVSYAVKINNKGEGFMSGTNKIYAMIAYEQIMAQLSSFSYWIAENMDSIKTDLNNNGCIVDNVDLHISFGQGKKLGKRILPDVFVYEKTSGAVLVFPENKPIELVTNILKMSNII